MMMIGSSVDYVRSGGMRNVPVTKAVEHLYATTAKFSLCVLLASRPAYSDPPRRRRSGAEQRRISRFLKVTVLFLEQQREGCFKTGYDLGEMLPIRSSRQWWRVRESGEG
ncbi:hypothetical protein AVEN_239003-1 [Araneus ventricosus]|uniref:Uncharacterized protein n=1 Tax=Araneus ventricosus TaxID=182803 RepID=A0A4Y2TI93_ARAVE|nr:hypothetical protein AVEN_239003-1 [Araneus ventricosus]